MPRTEIRVKLPLSSYSIVFFFSHSRIPQVRGTPIFLFVHIHHTPVTWPPHRSRLPKTRRRPPPNSPAYPAPLVVAACCRAPVAHQGNPATAVYRRIPFPSPPRAPRRNPATFPVERRRKPGCCRTGSTRSRLHVLGRHLRRSAASLLRIQVSFPDSPCVPGIHHQRSCLLDFRLSGGHYGGGSPTVQLHMLLNMCNSLRCQTWGT